MHEARIRIEPTKSTRRRDWKKDFSEDDVLLSAVARSFQSLAGKEKNMAIMQNAPIGMLDGAIVSRDFYEDANIT